MKRGKLRIRFGKNKLMNIPRNSLILKNFDFLHELYNFLKQKKNKEAASRIRHATDEEIQTICELCHNGLNGNLPISRLSLRQKLNPVKRLLRKLGRGNDSFESKRRSLATSVRNQHGGLPLIPLLAPIISSLLGSVIASNI